MVPIISDIIFSGGFCLVSAFITCGLGCFVYAQKPSSTIHRLFFATMIMATYWATGEFFIWQADSLEGVAFWLKFSSFWPLTIVLGSHFILEFTGTLPGDKRRTIILICIYFVSLVLSFIGIFTDSLYIPEFNPGIGYFYIPAGNNPFCLIEILFTTFIMLWSLSVGFLSWRYTKPGVKHSRNGFLFAGIIVAVFFGLLSGLFLPLLHVHIPNLVFIGFVILSAMTSYAIWHYGLFVLSPENAIPEIMETMPDGLILVDMSENIVAVNKSAKEIFPSLKNSSSYRSVESQVPGEALQGMKEYISANGEISDFEISLPGSTVRYISVSGSVVRSSSGESSGFVFIVRDITQRKISENTLRVANNKLSLLTQLTRHDISNLITALAGYLSLLGEGIKDPQEKLYLGKSVEITERIMKQIEFSRNYQDIGSEKPGWVDLEKQVSGSVKNLSSENVRIELKIDPVLIYADPFIEKVFYNLIENALRHGGKITEIVISTEEQKDGSLVLRVKDDGVGIPEDEKERIFSYGYGSNTGFGLAFAREVLSVTGIGISENGVLGEGASFEIYVPKDAWKPRPGSAARDYTEKPS